MAEVAIAGGRLRFERVLVPSRAATVLVPILSIFLALVACGVVLLASGQNPFDVYRAMVQGSLGDRFAIAETLVKTIPLLLWGVGVSIAFRMQLWNIGAEGQFYLGAIAATGTALYLVPDWPAVLLIPAMMIAGLIGGGAWGFIPGVLRAYLGANETITSLMLNYVAILFSDYLVLGPWKNPQGFGFPGTKQFPDA